MSEALGAIFYVLVIAGGFGFGWFAADVLTNLWERH